MALVAVPGYKALAISSPGSQQTTNQAVKESKEAEIQKLKEQKEGEIQKIQAQKEQAKKDFEASKETAKQKIAEQKATFKERTEQERQKSCQAISANLAKRLQNSKSKATEHKAKFDKHLARIQEFHDKKQYTIANYDSLLVNAQAASSKAQVAIDTLSQYTTIVDCNNVGAATENIAGYKEALDSTKNALNAYRQSLKELLVAVKAGVDTAKPENAGGTN